MPGWRFAADYRPGQRGADVGGDFYDVFAVPDGQMVLLGDVTGMGVAAAALTSLVRHTAKTAATFDPRPAAILSHVNGALRQRPRIAPVTMICGLLQRRARSRSRSAAIRCRCSSARARRASKVAAHGPPAGRGRLVRGVRRPRRSSSRPATRCCSSPTGSPTRRDATAASATRGCARRSTPRRRSPRRCSRRSRRRSTSSPTAPGWTTGRCSRCNVLDTRIVCV